MGEIYKRAAPTIFARARKHSDAGIFNQSVFRDVPLGKICRIKHQATSPDTDSVIVPRYHDMKSWRDVHEVLNSRGRCFQEYFLSHHKLLYGSDQIIMNVRVQP